MSITEFSRDQDLAAAVKALADGQLVGFPTETVYGLGADATNPEAVAKIFAAKSRPTGHPLIVHVADKSGLHRFGRNVHPMAEKLVDAFWPGPLTVIVDRGDEIAPETTGGRNTVGLRMPDHDLTLELLRQFGEIGSGAVAGPSANRFGGVSPTTAEHVRQDVGDAVAVVLDGGPCRVGVESTIVDVSGPTVKLLRPGGISTVELEAVLGVPIEDDRGGVSRASGMLASHYAPEAQMALIDAEAVSELVFKSGDGLITIVGVAATHDAEIPVWVLPEEAGGYAARLYSTLREADRQNVRRLLVVPPQRGQMLDAVTDRLAKAAAPRL